ncbi:hypothetical protein [Syntrophotalea acetylenivorans]|nr:hypothetical protein [Syntrophotalea acetylenivorans]
MKEKFPSGVSAQVQKELILHGGSAMKRPATLPGKMLFPRKQKG